LYNIEETIVLSLPYPRENDSSADVFSCLDRLTREEHVPNYFCRFCNKLGKSTKKISIWRLPDLLILHLKKTKKEGTRDAKEIIPFPTENLEMNRYSKRKNGGNLTYFCIIIIRQKCL